jgi:hypothetical protein
MDRSRREKPRLSERIGALGGSEGTRTPDPLHAMQVRYQLRHRPMITKIVVCTSGRKHQTSVHHPMWCP